MFNVETTLVKSITNEEKGRIDSRIREFVNTLDMSEMVNVMMMDIRYAIDYYIFGQDEFYQVFVPVGIAKIGKSESVVSVSREAGTARTPERTVFLRLLFASKVHEKFFNLLEDRLYYASFVSEKKKQEFSLLLVAELGKYACEQETALQQSSFMKAIRTISTMERFTTESRYELRGPLKGRGKYELELKYDALKDVQAFHNTYLGSSDVHFYLSKVQYDELKEIEKVLYAIGLQLSDNIPWSRHPENYNEQGFLDLVKGKEIRRQKRQKYAAIRTMPKRKINKKK